MADHIYTMKPIIWAEREPLVSRAYEMSFSTTYGGEVKTVETGGELLEKLETGIYCCALTSYILPDMTGQDIIERIKENSEKYHDVPIIMVSGTIDSRVMPIAKLRGDAFFKKPFDLDELVNKIKELTGQ